MPWIRCDSPVRWKLPSPRQENVPPTRFLDYFCLLLLPRRSFQRHLVRKYAARSIPESTLRVTHWIACGAITFESFF